MLTERDVEIIKFVTEMKAARMSTLREIFFNDVSHTVAYRTLKRLTEYQELERKRHYANDEYIYYIPKKKPKQLRHTLLVSEFYQHLQRYFNIVHFETEYTKLSNIRPDLFIAFKNKETGKGDLLFIEVELSNPPNVDKYIELYKSNEWKKHYPKFPIVIFVTNRKIEQLEDFKVIKIKEDFSNIKDFISNLGG